MSLQAASSELQVTFKRKQEALQVPVLPGFRRQHTVSYGPTCVQETAAVRLQSLARGFLARRAARRLHAERLLLGRASSGVLFLGIV